MAVRTTPLKQIKALMFLVMIASGQAAAISRNTAAAGIATLALTAYGARDDGTRAISVHGAGHQVLADSRKQEANELFHAHNHSLMEARTGCGLPTSPGGWVKFAIGKSNYGAGIPFVGVVLSAVNCAQARKSRCIAGHLLKEANAGNEDWEDEFTDETVIQDIAILECEVRRANEDVFNGCIMGFALSLGSSIAGVATAGLSAAITTPLAAAVDAADIMRNCWVEEHPCGFTSVDPRSEGDKVGLLSGKKKGKLTKMKEFFFSKFGVCGTT